MSAVQTMMAIAIIIDIAMTIRFYGQKKEGYYGWPDILLVVMNNATLLLALWMGGFWSGVK